MIDRLFPAGIFKNFMGKFFGFDKYTSQISTFVTLLKVIIILILVLYARHVLGLGPKNSLVLGALVFLVFFTNFWIFGSLMAVGLTVIAFLLIGILGFIS